MSFLDASEIAPFAARSAKRDLIFARFQRDKRIRFCRVRRLFQALMRSAFVVFATLTGP